MTDQYDPHDLVRVEARVPAWLLDAASDKLPDATTSELIRRGLAALAGVDPPVVRMGRHVVRRGRHERNDTP